MQSVKSYKKLAPLTVKLRKQKLQFDEQLKENLISRKRFVVVCGPCSADDPVAMEEYLCKLKAIADECSNLLVVARIYTSKPHSNGQGYKGTAFQLAPSDSVDIDQGIVRCRQMMLKCLEIGLPVADEMLYPDLYGCFDDLVSYWFVGARSSEDSLHRGVASGLDVCCGIKNATDGNVDKVVDSLYAVGNSCVFPYCGMQIVTEGCKYAHIVLRGGSNEGKFVSNITVEHIKYSKQLLGQYGMNDFVMADLNHANSGKVAERQMDNAKLAVLAGVDGVMIESYLNAGGHSSVYGTSQTDDCISFEQTQKLLRYLQAAVNNK
ncbi:MAG: 3-deoxy-7-phosphoheptulonate synthase [Clostridiales bacterium]|nr:3-deoxy-7-phosphoheptulonate synthase [Clostridiales bacterium]